MSRFYEHRGVSASAGIEIALEHQRLLWALAVLFYGIGDTVTTTIGLLWVDDAAEIGPIALVAIETAGMSGLLVLKVVFFAACFGLFYLLPSPTRVAIPLALTVMGIMVTAWNTIVIIQ